MELTRPRKEEKLYCKCLINAERHYIIMILDILYGFISKPPISHSPKKKKAFPVKYKTQKAYEIR